MTSQLRCGQIPCNGNSNYKFTQVVQPNQHQNQSQQYRSDTEYSISGRLEVKSCGCNPSHQPNVPCPQPCQPQPCFPIPCQPNPCPQPCPPIQPCPPPFPPTPVPTPDNYCGCTYPYTFVSARNPLTPFLIPNLLVQSFERSNINLQAINGAPNVCTTLARWAAASVTDASIPLAFNRNTGVITIKESGDYQFRLVVNFFNPYFIKIDINNDEIPYIELINTADPTNRLLASMFPVSTVVIPPPSSTTENGTIETYLAYTGQIVLDSLLSVVAGQQLVFRACSNGLQYVPPQVDNPPVVPAVGAEISLAPTNGDTTLTFYKVRNTPSIAISI